MRSMIVTKASNDSEADGMPSEPLLTEVGTCEEQFAKAGILLVAEVLRPNSKSALRQFNGKRRTITDGPFIETKELLGGYRLECTPEPREREERLRAQVAAKK